MYLCLCCVGMIGVNQDVTCVHVLPFKMQRSHKVCQDGWLVLYVWGHYHPGHLEDLITSAHRCA